MTQVCTVYAQALYDLSKDEQCVDRILNEMNVVKEAVLAEPDFLKLLSAANLSKQERCAILDRCFRQKVHPYLLNFMKLLVEKAHIRLLAECCSAFRKIFNQDHGILEVTAVTAVELTEVQKNRLAEKISAVTEKSVDLICRLDPCCIGGIRLDYEGKRIDGTVQNRLNSIAALLKNTTL